MGASTPARPLEVIVAGAGSRGRAWAALLARSPLVRLAALVARDPDARAFGADVPRFASLDAALAALPNARVAAALPPRASLDVALALASAGRSGLVEAPLSLSLAGVELPSGADAIQVAHGWVTLPGASWLGSAIARRPAQRVAIEVAGLPEERGGDPEEVLIHALALALRLAPDARVARAERRKGTIDVELPSARGAIMVRARADGQHVHVRAQGSTFELRWQVEGDRETLASRSAGAPRRRERAIEPGPVRALHQLVAPGGARGDDLRAAQRGARLALDVRAAIGRGPLLGARALRQAASISRRRPDDVLAQLGLRGPLPTFAPAPRLAVRAPPEPLELWLFRAGQKPVAFLTTHPHDADRVATLFEGAHVERRERRVHVGPQDAWIDRRDLGEARVELYVSHDPALAREAARLQTECDPSAALRELGALMGYPPCCVEAFAEEIDRSNNTANRYATAARTRARERWPWELANLHTMLIPCYPCSYTCAAALELARGALEAMEAAHPGIAARLRGVLARPVLYFDHARQIVLHGEASGHRARYAGASIPSSAGDLGALGGAIAAGDELVFDDDRLEVRAAGRVVVRLARTDPGLGLLAPFA